MIDEPVHEVTPTTIADNLSDDGKRPVNTTEEPVVFMTKSKLEAVFRNQKEKASVSSFCLALKPPQGCSKAVSNKYVTLKFKNFDSR